jgi:hypothetical protein
MFLEDANWRDNMLRSVKKVHSFKVFKRSTKFKRYNRGLTKFILNRRKYILRKKISTAISLFFIPLYWTKVYQVKRQLSRFFQSFYLLNYTMTLSSYQFVIRCYDNFINQNNFYELSNFKVNTASLTKSILLNNSLFRNKIFKDTLTFFKFTKLGITLTQNVNNTLNVLNSGVIISDRSLTSPIKQGGNSIQMLILKNLYLKIFKVIIHIIKNLNYVFTKLILLNTFFIS